jgi:hypothetical protein
MPRKFKNMVEDIIVQEDRKGFTFLDENFKTLDMNLISEIASILREDYSMIIRDYIIVESSPSAIALDSDDFGLHEIATVFNIVDNDTGQVYNPTLTFTLKIQFYILAASKNITLEMYTELLDEDPYYSDDYKKVILLNNKIDKDLYLYVRL